MLYFVLTGFLKNLIIYLLEMYIRTGLHFTKEVHNMLHILSLDDGLDIFKALGSEIRVEIVKLLLENKSMNMNELANKLNITNGALTSHIKKLESCGIVTTSNESAGHGNQKICSIHVDKILIELQPRKNLKMYIIPKSRSDIIRTITSIRPADLRHQTY